VHHARRWRIEEYLEVLPSLTPARLTSFLPTLLGRAFLEALVVGNVDPGEARGLVGGALAKLQAAWGTAGVLPGQEKDLRIVKLPAGEEGCVWSGVGCLQGWALTRVMICMPRGIGFIPDNHVCHESCDCSIDMAAAAHGASSAAAAAIERPQASPAS
jgi:hypothetical protein